MTTPRVLILVLSMEREPWSSIETAQRETWALSTDDGAPPWFYYGVQHGLAYWANGAISRGLRVAQAPRARSAWLRAVGCRTAKPRSTDVLGGVS